MLEKLFGKTRAQQGAAILQNFDQAKAAMDTMREAAGSADREMGIIQESLDYKLNALKETWVGFIQQLADRGTLGNIIDFLTTISELLTNLTKFDGLIPTILGGVASGIYNFKSKDPHGIFGIDFDSIKNIFESIRFEKIVPPIEQVRVLLSDIRALSDGQGVADLADTFGFDTDKIQDFIDNVDLAEASEKDLQEALTVTEKRTISGTAATVAHTAAQKAAAIASRALSIALQTVGVALASWLISEGISRLMDLAHQSENAADSLSQLKSKINETNSTLSENTALLNNAKNKYSELAQGVDNFGHNVSLSESDYQDFVNLNNQIASKFPELIKGYNSTGEAILNIGKNAEETTKRLDEQIAREEHLANIEIAKESGKTFDDNYSVYNDKMTQLDYLQRELEHIYKTYNFENGQVTNRVSGYTDFWQGFSKLPGMQQFLEYMSGEEDFGKFVEIYGQDRVEEFRAAYSDFLNTLTDERREIFEQAIVADKNGKFELDFTDIEFSQEEYDNFIIAYQRMRKSIVDSIKAEQESLKNEIQQTFQDTEIPVLKANLNLLLEDTSLGEEGKELATTIVSNLDASVQEQIAGDDGTATTAEIRNWVQHNIIEPIEELDDQDIAKVLDNILNFDHVTSDMTAYEYNDYVRQLIASLKELTGFDEEKIRILLGIDLDTPIEEIGYQLNDQIYKNAKKFNVEFDPIELPLSDQQDVVKWGKKQWGLYAQELKNAANADKTPEEIVKIVQQKLGKGITENSTISNAVNNIYNNLKPALEALGNAYQKIFPNGKGGKMDLSVVDVDMLQSLRQNLEETQEAAKLAFDPKVVEHFFDIITDGESTTKEVQEAFDEMATSAYKNAMVAPDVNLDSFNAIKQMLSQLGVENANIVTLNALLHNTNVQAEKLAETGATVGDVIVGINSEGEISLQILDQSTGATRDLTTAENQALQTMMNGKATVSEYTQMFAALTLEKKIESGTWLDESTSINELMALATAAGIAQSALDMLKGAKSAVSDAKAQLAAAVKTGFTSEINEATAALGKANEETKNVGAQIMNMIQDAIKGFGDLGKAAGGAGGAAKDAADETVDALSKINSEIDALQDAYEKLTKIEETYNEYGHITIDQAQELANMDLAVIAALTEETGTLQTSAEAYDMLTQAKIAELQASLVRKAMDLISSFQNEANAVAFLAQTYLTAADAAMTFASAAAFAESMNFAAGSTQDQATQKALAALQTQLQMVGSVDPHLTLSGGGGGHEPMDRAGSRESEGEGAGQSYEQDFDWIEKLLERLNKLTAKWTDRADRFFTFWNKNWATNKAIQANQKEQEANQKAYTYYLKEANKVDIDKDYKNRIQNGSMLAEVIEDEELGKKIEEYQKW